jgi:hypothetical protein
MSENTDAAVAVLERLVSFDTVSKNSNWELITEHIEFPYDQQVGCVHDLIAHMTKTAAPLHAALLGEPSDMEVVDAHKGSRGLVTGSP